MTTNRILILLAFLLTVAPSCLPAADAPAVPPARQEAPTKLTPEEREARRKLVRQRIEKKIETLKQKKAEGTLTEAETKQLEQSEQRLKRLEVPPKALPKPSEKPVEKPVDKQ